MPTVRFKLALLLALHLGLSSIAQAEQWVAVYTKHRGRRPECRRDPWSLGSGLRRSDDCLPLCCADAVAVRSTRPHLGLPYARPQF